MNNYGMLSLVLRAADSQDQSNFKVSSKFLQHLPFVPELKVLELLFLHALHQSLEELQLLVDMSTRHRVLLGHMSSYHVCPLYCLFVYQCANLQSYKHPNKTVPYCAGPQMQFEMTT